METKHTPGPWLHRGKSDSIHRPSETHPYGELIFQFHDENGPSDADLALILAAPELLEALLDCRRALEIANFTQELAVLNAVVAKATGEQS